MTGWRRPRAWALTIVLCSGTLGAFQQQGQQGPPGMPPAAAVAPATLAGAVVTTEGKLAAGVSVVIFPADEFRWATATPDEVRRVALTNGAYRMPNLPPGDYRVAPAADATLRDFPSDDVLRRLAVTALPVTLAAGEQIGLSFTVSVSGNEVTVTDASLTRTEIAPGGGRLAGPGARVGAPRAPGAISGRIIDAQGQPIGGVAIRVLRRVALRGSPPQPIPIGTGAVTDASGRYRLSNVAAGSYVIAALAFASPSGPAPPTGANQFPAAPPRADGTTMGYATTFFPGSPTFETALPVRVGTTEVTNVDFMLMPVPVADITGQIQTESGVPFNRGFVVLLPEAIDDHMGGQNVPRAPLAADGTFAFTRIPYGRYILTVSGGPAGWIRQPIDLRGPVEPAVLTMQQPFTVSGRIEITGGRRGAAAFDYSQLTVTLDARPLVSGSIRVRAITSPDGTFTIPGVPGGSYALQATSRTPMAQLSGFIGGVDSLDVPVDVTADATDAVILLAPRPSSLRLTVRDGANHPAAGVTIVFFSDDRAYWTMPSRRAQILRSPAGTATLSEIPPGKYSVVAGYDLAADAPPSPAWFESLLPRATSVTVAPGADRSIEVKLTSR